LSFAAQIAVNTTRGSNWWFSSSAQEIYIDVEPNRRRVRDESNVLFLLNKNKNKNIKKMRKQSDKYKKKCRPRTSIDAR